MANTDESILGLLLRAHARVSEQKHGEEFVHHNSGSMSSYEMARQSIESAIQNVFFAEMQVARQQAEESMRKELAKKAEANRG